jgi:protein-glutamine gamma-glutamyltransferase
VSDGRSTAAVPAARGLMFVLLCGFSSLQWMHMLEPVATDRARYALGAAVLAMIGLLLAGRLPPRLRTPAAVAVAVAVAPLALVGGGVADELLRPDRWGDLAAAIGRGVSALPGARVPYRGIDEWTRIVLAAGGTTIAVAAALTAFWPRPHGGLGFRYVALVLLLTLYAVPVVAVELGAEFLSGALLSVLVVGYLRLEGLQFNDAGAAAMLAAAVTILGLAAAPALDTDEPWFDYETWALSNAASKSTSFAWEHGYGPLDWPRDGRELLRVKARQPAYWKAANLDEFDGRRWVRDEGTSTLDGCTFSGVELEDERKRWQQRIQVSVRNLRSSTFVTAGTACAILAPRLDKLPLGDGTYATATRALRRGDAYGAIVYTPLPNERERRTAGDFHPLYLQHHTRITLPGKIDPLTGAEPDGDIVTFPLFADEDGRPLARPVGYRGPEETPAERLLEESSYARSYALAQRLRAASASQEDFVQRVMRHLRRGYSYTEAPPRAAQNLEGFLFDARSGYCQQFSGAMALLLRMGGVPARVSTGFTTGSFDRKAGEYVVRDLDAHSWVEVHYYGIGWVTLDPTPAASPARSQPDEDTGGAAISAPGAPDLGGDIRSDPSRQVAVPEEGPPWTLIGFAVAAAVAAAAFAAWLLRRRRRRLAAGWGPLAELERALRRARRAPRPGTTLNALEAAFGRSPAAAGYVRAIRDQRYGGRPVDPPPAGRRAVRSELGRGGGLAGRLRAWWAMPPKPR